MSAWARTRSRRRTHADRAGEAGFSLVEVLVVVLVLAVLAGIVFLALRGTTGSAVSAACDTDRQTVERAVDAYRQRTAALLTEEALVTAGYLSEPSVLFDVTNKGVVVPAPAGGCKDGESALGTPAGSTSGSDPTALLAGDTTIPAPTGAVSPDAASTSPAPVPGTGGVRGAVVPPTAPAATTVAPSASASPAPPSSAPPASSPSAPSGPAGTLPFATVPAPATPAPVGATVPGDPPSTTGPGKVDEGLPPVPTGPPATVLTALDRRALVVTLTWTGNADLDLWVQDPQGSLVGWASPTAPSGGFLDIDVVPPRPDALGPHVERITWPVTGTGPYTAWVRFASGGWGRQSPGTGFTITARADDELLGSAQGPIGRQGEQSPAMRVVLGTS